MADALNKDWNGSGKPMNWWWDLDANEHLAHDPWACIECNYRWWTSRDFVPAKDRMGVYKNDEP